MSLEIRNLSYAVDQFQFSEINLAISDETYFILLGPTGSGKSSLLKCILGINQIKTGEIFIDGKSIANLTVEKRNIGYLPQNCALFPHLDVRENINFGMRIRNYPETEIKERTGQLLSLFNIEHLANRSTRNLSGGEKQKVSLARALATRPALLLLDEPFSAVDEGTKKRLWFELKKVFKTVKVLSFMLPTTLKKPTAWLSRSALWSMAVSDRLRMYRPCLKGRQPKKLPGS